MIDFFTCKEGSVQIHRCAHTVSQSRALLSRMNAWIF
jgi:hypothetical protein